MAVARRDVWAEQKSIRGWVSVGAEASACVGLQLVLLHPLTDLGLATLAHVSGLWCSPLARHDANTKCPLLKDSVSHAFNCPATHSLRPSTHSAFSSQPCSPPRSLEDRAMKNKFLVQRRGG